MLSLGIKEGIINDDTNWKTALAGGILTIEGFGKFDNANASAKADIPNVLPVLEVSTVVLPTAAAAIPAGDVYTVSFFVKTTRYQAEMANDYIRQGRPIVIQVVGDGTSTMAVLIVAAIDARNAAFKIGDPTPFTVALNVNDIDVTMAHASYRLDRVSYRLKNDVLETNLAVTITVDGTEGSGNGSQLEESVRMGFGENVNPYGVKAGTNIDIGAVYNEYFWKMNVAVDEKVGYVLDEAPLSRIVSFNVFVKSTATQANVDLAAFIALP